MLRPDRKWLLLAITPILFPARAGGQIVFNEIMYAPVSPEPEWLELYNPKDTTCEISSWKLRSGTKQILLPSMMLAARGYVVLTKDSLSLRRVRPGVYPIIQVALPALRNTGDSLMLRDTAGMTIDSLYYLPAWGGTGGRSLERKSAHRESTLASNWGTSASSTGATPGTSNSIAILDYDLAICRAISTDSSVSITIQNVGWDTVWSTAVVLSGFETDVLTVKRMLAPEDTLQIVTAIPLSFFGTDSLSAIIFDSLDLDYRNDSAHLTVTEPIPRDSLILNEIMFAPQATSCEWIELYNPSPRRIMTRGLTFHAGSKSLSTLSLPSFSIPPLSYGLLSADSAVLAVYPGLDSSTAIGFFDRSSLDLSNDSASIVLRNADSTTIDSVRYYKSWQHALRPDFTGISLERIRWNGSSIDPSNWQASYAEAGATPLAPNSVGPTTAPTVTGSSFEARFEPNPFSPDGDGFEDQSTLTVQAGINKPFAARVRLFDARGRLVRTIADGTTSVGSLTLQFDGRNDNGQSLRPGIYTALVELTLQSPNGSLKKTIGVAIAGKRK